MTEKAGVVDLAFTRFIQISFSIKNFPSGVNYVLVHGSENWEVYLHSMRTYTRFSNKIWKMCWDFEGNFLKYFSVKISQRLLKILQTYIHKDIRPFLMFEISQIVYWDRPLFQRRMILLNGQSVRGK